MQTVSFGTMEYETAPCLSAPHGFTTRLGGVSEGRLGGLNLALHRGDREAHVRQNWQLLSQALDFDLKKLVLTHQTHSSTIRLVTDRDAAGLDHHRYPVCDGLITNTPGVSLFVFTADCTPILLHDPVTGAVGAVHAGWRGTAANIAGKAVAAMVAAFGCDPSHIRAAIGPNIGPCCFETDADVPQAMTAAFGSAVAEYIRPQGNKFYVNLKAINAHALATSGVQTIDISPSCTVCSCHRFFSHRTLGPDRGSQGAIIVRR